MTTQTTTTAERLTEFDAEHRAAERERDRLLASNAPRRDVDAAWREVSRLAGECHKVGAVRLAELLAEEAAA